ncbi:MAG: hypothetical protein GX638_14535, partial [Crenarchaeota archaeon]|nr:hypothetical protein [Thermoproteota archaeon]
MNKKLGFIKKRAIIIYYQLKNLINWERRKIEPKMNHSALRIGLLIVAVSWFLFTGYQFIKGAFNIFRGFEDYFWISFTDTAGTFGLGFRTVAALIAVFTILFFVLKKDLSKIELTMSIRWILLGEIVAMGALLPVLMWSIALATGNAASNIGLGSFVESTLPIIIESIVIPVVLVKLFFELNPKKPANSVIKWSLIAGTVYIFMFWINNTGNWIGAIERSNFGYVTAYPDHIISFGLTTIGLLALALYMAYFTKNACKAKSFAEIDMRKIGAIITALGLYFLSIYVMWLLFGTVDKWSTWYAWFLGHNMDLWALSLPLVGLPLLFSEKPSR